MKDDLKRVEISNREYEAIRQFADAVCRKCPYKMQGQIMYKMRGQEMYNRAIISCINYYYEYGYGKRLKIDVGHEILIESHKFVALENLPKIVGNPYTDIVEALLPKTVRTRSGKIIKYGQIIAIIGRR